MNKKQGTAKLTKNLQLHVEEGTKQTCGLQTDHAMATLVYMYIT